MNVAAERTLPSHSTTVVQVEGPLPLALIGTLCERLNAENITYCHWKSTTALDRSAQGKNDLDLLISRADGQAFAAILHQLGFKEALHRPAQQLPGVLDYYGYDAAADKFVHVHAHYQLILGDDMTKNYHLPLERPFLEGVTRLGLFPTPSAEFEFIIFVLRMTLKYAAWDAWLARQGQLPASARRELEDLRSRTNQPRLDHLLTRYLPWIEPAFFGRCLQTLDPECSRWRRMRTAHQLQQRLKAYARLPPLEDVSLKLWRRGQRAFQRRVFKGLPQKRLAHGGRVIAIIGGDGAGKSTAIEELYTWLSQEFDTLTVHLGRPTWSWGTTLVRGTIKLARWLGMVANPKPSASTDQASGFPGYPPVLWEVCTARDRYRVYGQAQRFAANGGLVICDRFPLPDILTMDGPQVEQMLSSERKGWWARLLINLEKKYYRPMLPPDVLIVLKLDPELAVQRKPEEKPAFVRARNQAVWMADWQLTSAHLIDAAQPRAGVVAELKRSVWSNL